MPTDKHLSTELSTEAASKVIHMLFMH